MKKLAKVLCLMAVALCMGALLAACGDDGVKYNYSKTTISVDGDNSGMGSAFNSMSSMYDTMYKGSYIEVSDDNVKWVYGEGTEGKMSVKKDGDKYILGGEMTEQIKTAVSQMGAQDIKIEMTGRQTDDGFEIDTVESFTFWGSTTTMTITFVFTKA